MELDRLDKTAPPQASIEPEPAGTFVKKETERRELLGDLVKDYKAAETIQEMEEQILYCSEFEADSIEVSPLIFRKLSGNQSTPYVMYKNIKCYPSGTYTEVRKYERRDVNINPHPETKK